MLPKSIVESCGLSPRASAARRRGGVVSLAAVLLAAGGLFAGGSAQGTVIISDTFSGTNGSLMLGRTPNTTNLPGGTWQANGSSYPNSTKGGWENDIQNNQAKLGADVGDAIALTGGSVTAAPSYTVSTTFNISQNPSIGTGRGAGLGFFANDVSTNNTHGWYYFTGVTVQSSGTGATVELIDSAPSGSGTSGSPNVLATGTVSSFDASVSHTLSYTVNTSTGTMSGLLLDGNAVSLSGAYTPPFTPTNTALAGIFDSAASGSDYNYFSNFAVSVPTVPETSTLALLVAAGAGGLVVGKRRRKSA